MFKLNSSIALAIALVSATAAQAHTKVVSSSPAANASVSPTNTIKITFNEKAMAAVSGADVVMTGMPGMAKHAPTKITGLKTAWSPDGKTVTMTAGRPFPKGTYQVAWHAAGADTHRMMGNYTFMVK